MRLRRFMELARKLFLDVTLRWSGRDSNCWSHPCLHRRRAPAAATLGFSPLRQGYSRIGIDHADVRDDEDGLVKACRPTHPTKTNHLGPAVRIRFPQR